jgi:hypothetical protein
VCFEDTAEAKDQQKITRGFSSRMKIYRFDCVRGGIERTFMELLLFNLDDDMMANNENLLSEISLALALEDERNEQRTEFHQRALRNEFTCRDPIY